MKKKNFLLYSRADKIVEISTKTLRSHHACTHIYVERSGENESLLWLHETKREPFISSKHLKKCFYQKGLF